MQLVCFDTETTGLDVQKEHIIQLSLVKFDTDNWQVTDQRDWYILPEGEFTIPAEAEAVHHISKEFLLEHGVSMRSVYDDFLAFTKGCDMLSYNGNGYDAPLLHYNLQRLGLNFDFDGRTWYDALLLERIHTAGMVDENGEKLHNNLTSAYTRYYGHPFEGAHNSLDDVMATIEVFKAQVVAHGWEWAQREEFGFISYDRWLCRKNGTYVLAMSSWGCLQQDRLPTRNGITEVWALTDSPLLVMMYSLNIWQRNTLRATTMQYPKNLCIAASTNSPTR